MMQAIKSYKKEFIKSIAMTEMIQMPTVMPIKALMDHHIIEINLQ